MKYDPLLVFVGIEPGKQQEIQPYFSPQEESSLFKYVPLGRMQEFKHIAKTLYPDSRIRVRFRGKRSGAMRDYTKKKDATSVAIYVDEP